MLQWLFDPPDRLTRLARRADKSGFAAAFGSAKITFLGLPDGFGPTGGLDPVDSTDDELIETIESAAKCLSTRDWHTALRLEDGGESVVPLFTREKYARQFVFDYVRIIDRILPFFLVGVDGESVAASIAPGEVVLLNPGTRHELRLSVADLTGS